MYHFPRFVDRETQYTHENSSRTLLLSPRSLLEHFPFVPAARRDGNVQPPAHSDDELVRSLQQRLKPGRGPLPKPHIVRAAIALAKDDRQEPTPAWLTTHGVPTMGDAKTRVLTLRA